jgi:hypothetical protein
MYVPGHYLVNTSALGHAASVLGKAYGRMTIAHTAAEGDPWIRIWRTQVGPVTLDDAEITSAIRCEMASPTGVLLCRVRAGRVEFRADDRLSTYERGDVVAIACDGAAMTSALTHARCDIVSFDRGFLAEAATEFSASGCPQGMQRFARPVSPTAGQLVADVIDHIRHFIANNAQVASEPLVVGSAARYLMAAVLTAFPCDVFGV